MTTTTSTSTSAAATASTPALTSTDPIDARIAALEKMLADRAAQDAKDEGKGSLAVKVDAVLGKSWSTTLWGVLAGSGSIVAMVPSLPSWAHQVAAVATAIGVLMIGVSAKSKNVTGTEK